MATQYGQFIRLAKRLLRDRGVTVTYGTYAPELMGQAVDTDNRVEKTYRVNVFFGIGVFRRQSGTMFPEDLSSVIMEVTSFEPKTGDYLINPKGKRFPVEAVTAIEPDGYPLFYKLTLGEG